MSPPSSPEEEAQSSPEEQERPSNHPMSLPAATTEKLDDIAQVNIVEDFDNRPSKKAKISESSVLEPSPMSPTMSTSSPGSECFESIVPESDNQMNHDTLSSPRSTISPVFPLHDVKEPDSHKEIKVYDYLPQDYTLTDHDLCAHIAIESSLRKELLVQIDGSSVLQHQLMCPLDKKEWVNDDVSTLTQTGKSF
nr:uncharacterized protein LOC120975769 [Aegilops tauschii subsp. strangulata]